MTSLVADEPRLADRVYIPKVHTEFSTKKVMTAEWIDGVRLSDRPAIKRLMGEGEKDSVPSGGSFDGVRLKGGVKAVMQTMVELFSAQMFGFGWVHCDPHPGRFIFTLKNQLGADDGALGNIIIRPNPANPNHPQLVLLDHGLYVHLSETFKRQYATLWKSLISMDFDTIEGVTKEWGIGTPDLFASATLMRPVQFRTGKPAKGKGGTGEEVKQLDAYEQSVRMKEKLRSFLTDTDKMPQALVFLGRNMRYVCELFNNCVWMDPDLIRRMVQGNNQSLGSPVNRIKITGVWASRSLTSTPSLTLPERAREYWYYLLFRGVMLGLDLVFWESRVRGWARRNFLGRSGGEGFEAEMEKSMRRFAKSIGVEVAPGAFQG